MDYTNFIIAIFTTILTSGIIFYIQKTTNKTPEIDKMGQTVLKPSKIYQIYAYIGFAISAVFVVGFAVIQTVDFLIFTVPVLVLFGISAVYSLMIYNNHRVAFDDKTITITDKNGKNQMTTWEDITNLKYDTWSSSIVLKTKIKNKLKINVYCVGIKSFGQALEKNTTYRIKELKLPIQK